MSHSLICISHMFLVSLFRWCAIYFLSIAFIRNMGVLKRGIGQGGIFGGKFKNAQFKKFRKMAGNLKEFFFGREKSKTRS